MLFIIQRNKPAFKAAYLQSSSKALVNILSTWAYVKAIHLLQLCLRYNFWEEVSFNNGSTAE